MYKGINCERKSQLSEILTEPINPRAGDVGYFLTDFFPSAHFPMVFSQLCNFPRVFSQLCNFQSGNFPSLS